MTHVSIFDTIPKQSRFGLLVRHQRRYWHEGNKLKPRLADYSLAWQLRGKGASSSSTYQLGDPPTLVLYQL